MTRLEYSISISWLDSIWNFQVDSSSKQKWRQVAKNKNIEQYFRLFLCNKLTNCITFVHYLCALSLCIIFARKTRENTVYLFLFKILSNRIENSNQYSISTSWLDSNTWYQNSDLNQVLMSRKLDSSLMTRLDAITLFVIMNLRFLRTYLKQLFY
jgi:hypothetical protein